MLVFPENVLIIILSLCNKENTMKYDYLIVGSGLYGAIFAHEAKAKGKSVLVVDKRPNIAGNVYTQPFRQCLLRITCLLAVIGNAFSQRHIVFSFRVVGLSYNPIIAENTVAGHRLSLDFPQPTVAKGHYTSKSKAERSVITSCTKSEAAT